MDALSTVYICQLGNDAPHEVRSLLQPGSECFAHLFTFGQELDVGAAAVETVLELDLVRENEGFALGVKDLVERCRDGMVGGFGREDEAVVVLEAGVDFGFLDSPLSDVRKDLRGAPPAVNTVAGLTSGTSRNLFWAK